MSLTTGIGILFTLLLLIASIYDVKTRQIPNRLPLAIGILGLFQSAPLPAFLGLLMTGLPYFLAAVCSGGKIGGGDIKLMSACGMVLGPVYGTLQSILGLMLVLLFALVFGLRHGFQATKHTALPLAPFLSAGGALTYLGSALFHVAI
ncbi:prepilin peptidase [Paenibacillus luteus]|uniref:prepilin peptidase n=1 Tax=Paenibacillus luteus TaxID=2545753 RepID=UPI0011421CFD|nr:prepilin peptidase [Paenibacillus luteus]